MTPKFYQIRPYGFGYRLFAGDGLQSEPVHGVEPFETPQKAKAVCWQKFHHIAVRLYDDDEIPFNEDIPLHSALRAIEARYSGTNTVVAVGVHTYLVRRSRFGIEVQVLWDCMAGLVTAREDSERIYSV